MMDFMVSLADFETNFVSVERLAEYTRLPLDETPQERKRTVREWNGWVEGAEGEIVLSHVSMRYSLKRSLVLSDVSLRVRANSTVRSHVWRRCCCASRSSSKA